MRRESHGFTDVPGLTCDRIQFLDKANGGMAVPAGDDAPVRWRTITVPPHVFAVSCLRWTIKMHRGRAFGVAGGKRESP